MLYFIDMIIYSIIPLTVLYFLGNFLLLLNRGNYWDGWLWLTLLKAKEYDFLSEIMGRQAKVYLHYFLIRFLEWTGNPILSIKLLAFGSWLIAAIALLLTLKQLGLPKKRSFFVASSFSLIPLFIVKVEEMVLTYSICNLFFFLGALVYFSAPRANATILKSAAYLLSAILFLLSFQTNSFLVFYGGFLLIAFYRYKNTLLSFLKSQWLFILLPIFFWVGFKAILGEPNGIYADYNSFVWLSPKALVTYAWNGVVYGFFWPLIAAIAVLERKIFAALFLIIFPITYFILKYAYQKPQENNTGDLTPKQYLAWGILFFSLGLLPYLAVGKELHLYSTGANLRHALLLPLGTTLIMLGGIIYLIKTERQILAESAILSLFIVFSAYNYYWFDMDWYKQQSIIESLRNTESKEIQEATTLVFYDKIPGYNWQSRRISSTAYQGMINASGKLNKLAVTEDAGDGIDIPKHYLAFKNERMISDFDYSRKIVPVAIVSNAAGYTVKVANWLKIKKAEVFGSETEYLSKLKETLRIEIVPL